MRSADAGATILDIVLAPLSLWRPRTVDRGLLRCEPKRARPLVAAGAREDRRQSVFSIQFLYALADEALLVFDRGEARWSWDLDRIHAKGYTDNVVDLMVGEADPPARRDAEGAGAAGLPRQRRRDRDALRSSRRCRRSTSTTALWEAMRLELIELTPGAYAFIHDRVHEAAYALIPEDHRAATHLSIGRLLVAHMPPQRGGGDLRDRQPAEPGRRAHHRQDERERLAALNLIAGQRAKASAAYASALGYLVAGAALLPRFWEHRRELSFELELDRAECEFLTGAVAERRAAPRDAVAPRREHGRKGDRRVPAGWISM